MSKDFVEDGIGTDELIDIVKDIYQKTQNESNKTLLDKFKDIYKEKYSFFAERYPTLFNSLFMPNFDIKNFEYMMMMRKKIENDEESTKSASEHIGVKFFKQFHPDIKSKST